MITSLSLSLSALGVSFQIRIAVKPSFNSLALRALRKRKPQETQTLALASSQSWLPPLRPSIPIGWRLRLLRENLGLRFSFTQRTQRKRLRLNGNRALGALFGRRLRVV